MAGARKEDVNSAMMSILKKMDTMLENTNEVYNDQLVILSSIDTIQKNSVVVELQSQTKLLQSIESKLNAATSKGGNDIGDLKDFEKAFGSVGKVLTKLLKAASKIDDKTSERLSTFFTKLADSINTFNSKVDTKKSEAIIALLGAITSGVLKFALIMTLATPLLVLAMPGVALFGLSIRLLMATMGSVDRKSIKGMEAVLTLSKGIMLYVLAMLIVTVAMPIVLIGTLLFVGTLMLLDIGLRLIGDKNSRKGVLALIGVSLAIIFLGLAIALFSVLASGEAILKVVLTLSALGLIGYLIGSAASTIFKGALVLMGLGIALAVFSVGFLIFSLASKNLTWEQIGMMGAVIGAMALVGTVLGIPAVAPFAAIGAGILILLGAALVVFSVGFLIFATGMKLVDPETPALMGEVISEIGTAMAIAGLKSPFILLGSAAMIVAGAALLPITLGMVAFKASGFNKDDGDNLEYALGRLASGFLGGEMPGGLIANIKFAAKAAARAALLGVTAIGFLAAGYALLPITASMLVFKKAKFGKEDSDNLEYMLASVVKAFGIVTDYDRQKKLGFYVNPWDLMRGIASLSGAGRVLAGLAEGVQAWANLEVNEWEVVNGGTADAKLVIKGRRKLNKTDFENAAIGMSTVISAIAKPFADVGKLNAGQKTGNPILDEVFGNNYISKGINALKNSGSVITALAQGVQDFATMSITEWEVVNGGTADAKLVPKDKRKLTDPEIEAAGNNIAKIISIVADQIAKIGKDEADSEGIFSGGYLSKGMKAISGLGNVVSGVADAVIKIASGEIPQFTLINAGTADAKLVPAEPKKITDPMLKAAATTIGSIITLIAKEMASFGFWAAKHEGSINRGVEVTKTMTDALKVMAEPVENWSKIQGLDIAATNISSFLGTVKDTFDPTKNKNIGNTSYYFSRFTSNIVDLTNQVNKLDKVANNFDRIQKSMKLMQTHVNGMDLKKLTLTDSMMKSIAALSKNPEAIAKAISKSIEESFDELAKILKDMAKENSGGSTSSQQPSIIEMAKDKFFGNDDKTDKTKKAKQEPPQINFPEFMMVKLDQESIQAIKRG